MQRLTVVGELPVCGTHAGFYCLEMTKRKFMQVYYFGTTTMELIQVLIVMRLLPVYGTHAGVDFFLENYRCIELMQV
jgi:hypothetical protein